MNNSQPLRKQETDARLLRLAFQLEEMVDLHYGYRITRVP